MGFLDSVPDYVPVQVDPSPSPQYVQSVQTQNDRAFQPVDAFTAQNNQGVKDQSNLMGPSSQNDPQSSALSQRASNLYGSAVNQLMRNSNVQGTQTKMQLEGQSINNQAAQYANMQTKQQLNFQQISFARESAIVQEATKRKLYSDLFGGIASAGGMAAAAYTVKHRSPNEPQPFIPTLPTTNTNPFWSSNPYSDPGNPYSNGSGDFTSNDSLGDFNIPDMSGSEFA